MRRAAAGDEAADAEVTSMIYGDIRRLAAGLLRGERAGHTLQATALVHEAWIRLVDETLFDKASDTAARGLFQAHAVQAMRRVLIDHARARCADKRARA